MTPETIDVECPNPDGRHRIVCHTWGAAQHARPVVCAHGLSRNGRDFDALAQALAGTRRVYCPDTAGRGDSDWLARREHYNYPQYLSDAIRLVTRIACDHDGQDNPRPRSVDWIGTSMGGIVGMMLAARDATPIRRLVLNDIGACISADALNRIRQYIRTTPRFDSLGAYQDYLADIHADFGPLTDAQWAHLARHSYRIEDGQYLPHYDPAIAAAFDQPAAHDVEMWDLWQHIDAPTLVIRGTHSDLFDRETLNRMQALRPETEVLEVADAGHAPALMRDFEIEAIRAFVSESADMASRSG